MDLGALPTAIAELVESYVVQTGRDYRSADAMRGRCQDESLALARALDGRTIPSAIDDEPAVIESYAAQKWMDRVPAKLEGNELAGGHYVTIVRWDGYTYEIDITAAQFPELGWTAPRAREI